jgi:hypothetical protein
LLTLPHPITATLIFFTEVDVAKLSSDETSIPAPAAAETRKNLRRSMLPELFLDVSMVYEIYSKWFVHKINTFSKQKKRRECSLSLSLSLFFQYPERIKVATTGNILKLNLLQ